MVLNFILIRVKTKIYQIQENAVYWYILHIKNETKKKVLQFKCGNWYVWHLGMEKVELFESVHPEHVTRTT